MSSGANTLKVSNSGTNSTTNLIHISSLENLRNLKLSSQAESLDFVEFTKLISQKEVIEIVQSFCQTCFAHAGHTDIKASLSRIFLSHLVVLHHREILLEEESQINNSIYQKSQGVNKIFSEIENGENSNGENSSLEENKNSFLSNDTILALVKEIQEFCETFQLWKQADLVAQLEESSKSYYELEVLKSNVKADDIHKFYKNGIEPVQEKILKHIKNIGGEAGLKYLREYKYVVVDYDELLVQKITTNLKKAFWKKLQQDLEQNPPDFKMVPSILKDINMMLKSLVPFSKKYTEDLDDKIDADFLKGQIDNGVFSFEQIYALSMYIIDHIKKFGMPEDDTEVEKFRTWVKTTMSNTAEFSMAGFLPKLFEEFMTRIEKIQLRVLELSKAKTL